MKFSNFPEDKKYEDIPEKEKSANKNPRKENHGPATCGFLGPTKSNHSENLSLDWILLINGYYFSVTIQK